MTIRDLIDGKCAELKAEARGLRGTASIQKILERVLEEMMQLDVGMVNGQVVPPDVLSYGRDSFVPIAEGLFDRLTSSDERFAFDWLGQLPMFLQPTGIEYAAWRHRLGVPADAAAYRSKKRKQRDVEIDQILATVGDEGSALSLEKVEQCFNATLPEGLKDAWKDALGGGENILKFLVPRRGLRELIETARFVSEEQVMYDVVDEAVQGGTFKLLPIAEGFEDSDYVALNLSKPSPSRRDFAVLYCLHDAGEPGAQFASSAEWMERERPRKELWEALNDAVEVNEATFARVSEWVDNGEELEFDEWCIETMRARAPRYFDNGEDAKEARDRFWRSIAC